MKRPKKLRIGELKKRGTTRNKKFVVFVYASGVQQYVRVAPRIGKALVTLERYVPRKTEHRLKDRCTARRKWALVIRDPWHDDIRFPPIYAGPFESLELALLAWELMS